MNRTTVAALITTAVIGVTAGTVTAVLRGEDPTAKPPTAQKPGTGQTSSPSTPTPTPSQAPVKTGQLLWADDQFIHDGAAKIGFPGTPGGAPDRLVRARGGYLLAYDNGEGSYYDQTLYFVAKEAGTTQILDGRARSWDLDPEGDRVAIHNLRNIQVVDFEGVVQQTTKAPEGELTLYWSGQDVVITTFDAKDQVWRTSVWSPTTGKTTASDQPGLQSAMATRDGRLAVGAVNEEGTSSGEESSCLGMAPSPGVTPQRGWFTCDWRLNNWHGLNQLSPDGKHLLAVDIQSDGFGPGQFGIVDVTKGPKAGVPTVDAPEQWMLDAAWVDDEHFVMVGSNGDEVGKAGGWLYQADADGNVTEVARTKTGRLTLGEQF